MGKKNYNNNNNNNNNNKNLRAKLNYSYTLSLSLQFSTQLLFEKLAHTANAGYRALYIAAISRHIHEISYYSKTFELEKDNNIYTNTIIDLHTI